MASDTFSNEEQEYYTALESQSQLKFSRFVKAGTVVKNYANSLMLLLRLRQACNHPLLCMDKESQNLAIQGRDAAIIATYAEEESQGDAAEADDDAELLDFSKPKPKPKAAAAAGPVRVAVAVVLILGLSGRFPCRLCSPFCEGLPPRAP